MKHLVVFGGRNDPHLTRVSRQLKLRDVDLFFFDTTADELVTYKASPSQPQHALWFDAANEDRSLSLRLPADDCVFWLRNKTHLNIIGNANQQKTYFRMSERAGWLLGAILATGAAHFNKMTATLHNENKLHQLILAQSLGFTTPATLISSDPAQIRAFVAELGGGVVKPLRTTFLPASRDGEAQSVRMMTSRVTPSEVDNAHDEELFIAPSIYQHEVPKHFEVRLYATSVGIVSYALYSREAATAHVDWRRDALAFKFEVIDAPADVTGLVERYMDRVDLDFGAFDFIVTPEGQWVFLECNSEGQWGWLEEETGPVTQMVVEQCVQFARSR